jgi:hypothetical protein
MMRCRLQKSLGPAELKHRMSSVPRTSAPTHREAAEGKFLIGILWPGIEIGKYGQINNLLFFYPRARPEAALLSSRKPHCDSSRKPHYTQAGNHIFTQAGKSTIA